MFLQVSLTFPPPLIENATSKTFGALGYLTVNVFQTQKDWFSIVLEKTLTITRQLSGTERFWTKEETIMFDLCQDTTRQQHRIGSASGFYRSSTRYVMSSVCHVLVEETLVKLAKTTLGPPPFSSYIARI